MKSRNIISRIRLQLRQKKTERLRRKSMAKKKKRNITHNCQKKLFLERKTNNRNNFRSPKKVKITANNNFSLMQDIENIITFIKNIDDSIQKNNYKIVELDLSQVVNIDIGCISILLAKINKLTRKHIQTICQLPKDIKCKQMFFESGFSDHMRDLNGRKITYSRKNNNLMVNRGFDKTSNEQLGSTIKDSVKHLTGVEECYRPVYSIAQEMCANSIEHANINNKNWLFSVWYKNTTEVCFTMTDVGEGILGTLRRKFSQIIKEKFLKDNKDILYSAFEKKYTSVTEDINRNKGLPKIKNISDKNYISNLVVITNDVFLDFSNSTNSRVLNRKFNGTFYYWELNQNCIERWKNRKLS